MLKLALAPVGAGKTDAALQRLTNILHQNRFARVWVLVATQRQQDAFRQRLVEYQAEKNLYFNVEFFDFYKLYRRLLNMARQPAYGLSDAARYGLLRTVIMQLADEKALTLYQPIAHTPGFLRIVAHLIVELKQNQVYPEDFIQAAQTQKDRELALIYSRYQAVLQREDLVDIEGEGWLALARLPDFPDLARDVDLLIVDGYDQFTIVQARLLQVLAERVSETFVTLTNVPEREATIGRRFQDALYALTQDLKIGISVDYINMPRSPRHPDLQHLIEQIFLPTARTKSPQATLGGGITLIETADAASEVGAALRHVKQLLLETECAPDDILIALRDWERYQPYLLAFGKRYHLPLALHYGEALASNPLMTTLMKVLTFSDGDFQRRDLFDLLRSPYLRIRGLGVEQVTILDHLSQRYIVIRGREQWDEAFRHAVQPMLDEDGDEQPPLLDAAQADALEFELTEFFNYITPPESATVEQYIDWLETLIGDDPLELLDDPTLSRSKTQGIRFDQALDPQPPPLSFDSADSAPYHLGIIAAIRAGDEATAARDLTALQAFKQVLRGMLNTQNLLTSLNAANDQPIAWEVFISQLRTAVQMAQINPPRSANRGGCVLVTTATNARGLPHRHIVILGLSEGIFPMPTPEDPLYLDSERIELTKRGVTLKTAAERATDDGVFYELLSLARDSLILTRPTAQAGQPWSPSHLWRAVQAVFKDLPVRQYPAGEVLPWYEAASLDEVMLSVADSFNRADTMPEIIGLYHWLLHNADGEWQRVRANREIEAGRISPLSPHNTYSGVLETPALVTRAAETLGSDRRWSATQFNDYGVCPFRFFAKRLLKLEELKPPREGMDNLQVGSVSHEILEKTYRMVQIERLSIAPHNSEAAVELLQQVAASVFALAPEKYGIRPTALWRQEQTTLLNSLTRLVWLDFSADNPIAKHFGDAERTLYQLEAAFGGFDGVPLTIPTDMGGDLAVVGKIDRIDRVGDALVVMDYKSGSSPFKLEDMGSGRNFQMVVYLLAAQAIISQDQTRHAPKRVAGGLFWHIRNGTISGKLDAEDRKHQAVFESALNYLGEYVGAMREGRFPVQPPKTESGKCVSYCEYRQLCRMCGLVSAS